MTPRTPNRTPIQIRVWSRPHRVIRRPQRTSSKWFRTKLFTRVLLEAPDREAARTIRCLIYNGFDSGLHCSRYGVPRPRSEQCPLREQLVERRVRKRSIAATSVFPRIWPPVCSPEAHLPLRNFLVGGNRSFLLLLFNQNAFTQGFCPLALTVARST